MNVEAYAELATRLRAVADNAHASRDLHTMALGLCGAWRELANFRPPLAAPSRADTPPAVPGWRLSAPDCVALIACHLLQTALRLDEVAARLEDWPQLREVLSLRPEAVASVEAWLDFAGRAVGPRWGAVRGEA